MDAIVKVYGLDANLYTDVLRVPPTASTSEIREAFFCLRYDIYQTLSRTDGAPNGSSDNRHGASFDKKPPLTPQERRKIEDKMNAITAAFRILSDGTKRKEYDARMKKNGKAGGKGIGLKFGGGNNNGTGHEATDEMGFPIAAADDNGGGAGRSIFRKSHPNTTPGGMNNAAPRAVAHPASEAMNPRRPRIGRRQELQEEEEERNRNENTNFDNVSDGNTPPAFSQQMNVDEDDDDMAVMGDNYGSDVATNHAANISDTANDQQVQQQQQQDNEKSLEQIKSFETNESSMPSMPAGVNDLNMREQMLYKNQMYMHKQQKKQMREQAKNSNGINSDNEGAEGRIGSKYHTVDRTDWLVDRRREESITRKTKEQQRQIQLAKKKRSQQQQLQKATSPKGVDQFFDHDNVTSDGDDETNTYTSYDDDDTRTYGSSSYYDDSQYDETTLGETTLEETTLGESTWASEYDDGTSVYSGNNSDHQAKYKPSHKNGSMPQPILRSSSSSRHYNRSSGVKPSAVNRQSSGNSDRRVTIHAHRGRGEDKDYRNHKRSSRHSDSDLDGGGGFCPFPSMKEINDEVMGTYKDASSAFHQVLHAFVISPDDIDRMADKIRDAKVELKETYDEQVRERRGLVRVGSSGVAGAVKKNGSAGGGRTIPIEKAFSS